jgi:diguanylate cyclase (GGDEF)-like protein
MSTITPREFLPERSKLTANLNISTAQLFEAVAEGNMHCYCLLQIIPDLEFDSDHGSDFRVVFANQKLIDLLKSPKKSIFGKRLSQIYPFSDNWIQCGRYFESIRCQRPVIEEFPLQIFDETRWYRHEIVPLSNELLSITAEDISERKLLEKKLVRNAHFDELTGLKNRTALMQFLNLTHERKNRITLVLIEIENFRSINQCFGSAAADSLLNSLSRELESLEEGSCYRISADTFAIAVARAKREVCVGEAQIKRWLNKLLGDYQFEGQQLPCELRAGYSVADFDDGGQIDLLLAEAEIATSEARKKTSSSVVRYSGMVMQRHQQRLSIGKYLPRALAAGEFFANFQPQYELSTGRVVGLEALCRWNHAELGSVSPEVFIAIAEQMDLLQNLDLQLLTSVVQHFRKLPSPSKSSCLSINASPSSLQSSRYLDTLIELSKLLPIWCDLEVEVTENAWIADFSSLKQCMLRLQDQGIGIALDDFGSGYSNLNYLSCFPFDKLKLDRCLIVELELNSRNADLVSGAIDLSHRLGLKVVAEGVETNFQRLWLRQAGCDIAQGYLMSKPMPTSAGSLLFAPFVPD